MTCIGLSVAVDRILRGDWVHHIAQMILEISLQLKKEHLTKSEGFLVTNSPFHVPLVDLNDVLSSVST